MSHPNGARLRNGIVAIVSLNPAASTAFVDPELNRVASRITTGKYAAILSGLSVDKDGNSLTNMYFVGPGMPIQSAQYDEDESMCIPLSPAKSHPLHRQPLELLRPLPWNVECYVRTLLTERQVRISSVMTSPAALPIMVKDAHINALIRVSEADLNRTRPAEIIMPISDIDSHSGSSSDEEQELGLEDEENDSGWFLELNSRPSKLSLTFDVWLDANVLLQLPDPTGLRAELERLYILQDKDTRRQYAQYRQMRRMRGQDPKPELHGKGKALGKGTGLGSWISRLFRKIFGRKGS